MISDADLESYMQQLSAFIRESFDVPEDDPEFDNDVHLFDYGYVDSFGAATLGVFIKETWNVEITDADLVMHSLNTVREISTLVDQKVRKSS